GDQSVFGPALCIIGQLPCVLVNSHPVAFPVEVAIGEPASLLRLPGKREADAAERPRVALGRADVETVIRRNKQRKAALLGGAGRRAWVSHGVVGFFYDGCLGVLFEITLRDGMRTLD